MKGLFPIVLGLTDGIITSLVFTAGLLDRSSAITLILILRISIGSSVIGAFSFFIANYTELREELITVGTKLNPAKPTHLLESSQGIRIVSESIVEASLALGSGFLGAFLTLFPAYAFPEVGILSLSLALAILSILGVLISRYLYGGPFRWALIFVIVGLITILLGMYLNIV